MLELDTRAAPLVFSCADVRTSTRGNGFAFGKPPRAKQFGVMNQPVLS